MQATSKVETPKYYGSKLLYYSTLGLARKVRVWLAKTKKTDINLCIRVDGDDDWAVPLVSAASEGHLEVVQVLIDAGADVDLPGSPKRCTSTFHAAQNGTTDLLNVLLEAGADVNIPSLDNTTPILAAVQKNRLDAVKMLIQKGKANINAPNDRGCFPLFVAATQGFEEITHELLRAGADVNQTHPMSGGITALQGAIVMNQSVTAEAIRHSEITCKAANNHVDNVAVPPSDLAPLPIPVMNTVPSPPRECAYCQASTVTHRCSRCKVVFYCDTFCQRASWTKHKKVCRAPEEI